MIEIRHRYTGSLLCAFEVTTIKEAVIEAKRQGANLYGADLRSADLYGADLGGANLRSADLYGADLGGANLYGANLYGANLRSANLRSANLYGANLYGADLGGANLRSANLYGANLYGANLYGADLGGANLRSANLYGANLYGANLRSANLGGANLRSADLYGAKNLDSLVIAQQSICPEGQIIGWKKLKGGVIAKLSIPADALRLNSVGSRKCRASSAYVLELSKGSSAYDSHTGELEYKVGEIVYPDSFDEDIFTECSHGIHFFITRIEAENC